MSTIRTIKRTLLKASGVRKSYLKSLTKVMHLEIEVFKRTDGKRRVKNE